MNIVLQQARIAETIAMVGVARKATCRHAEHHD